MRGIIPIAMTAAVLILACFAIRSSPVISNSGHFGFEHHDRRMRESRLSVYEKGPSIFDGDLRGYTLGPEWEAYEFHRQQLVKLGEVRELRFVMIFLPMGTAEARHFIRRRLSSPQAPSSIDWSFPDTGGPAPIDLTVWCYRKDQAAWQEFIESHDVLDYRSKFMTPLSP